LKFEEMNEQAKQRKKERKKERSSNASKNIDKHKKAKQIPGRDSKPKFVRTRPRTPTLEEMEEERRLEQIVFGGNRSEDLATLFGNESTSSLNPSLEFFVDLTPNPK